MMDRALARLVTDDNYFGYEDGEDPWGFDRNHRFTANLCANTEMNYPLMYQSLMSPFTVKPVMNNGLIILGWVCCAIILGSVGATIFIRKDFT
ncbi:hypothetical protein FACS1894166_08880 [Bacilli bacterium]|nr:hypothetical protein FACS1894166_08880 [Bacilli bacterium]